MTIETLRKLYNLRKILNHPYFEDPRIKTSEFQNMIREDLEKQMAELSSDCKELEDSLKDKAVILLTNPVKLEIGTGPYKYYNPTLVKLFQNFYLKLSGERNGRKEN
jgi:hypothetical protein